MAFFSCLSKCAECGAKASFRVMLKDFKIRKAFSVVICFFIIVSAAFPENLVEKDKISN